MKRRLSEPSGPVEKKRRVKYETYKKWVVEYDKDCQTMTWLDCETENEAGVKVVTSLKCRMCSKYKDNIMGRKNFNEKWITGADSVRTTNLRDHAKSDQHGHAMTLHRRDLARSKGLGATAYAPIAQALCTLSEDEQSKLRLKFDIAFFIASEQLPFTKYPRICELEQRHGVNLGAAYLNNNSCKEFTHYIAEANRQKLVTTISNAQFFSLLLDGSTDKSNNDNELLMVVWCDPNGTDEKIHTQIQFLNVDRPLTVRAEGLLQSLKHGLQSLGIHDLSGAACKKLVGIGTDGASTNIAARGLKGLVERELEWIFWMWCLAHRLELAVKDALKDSCFDSIDDMLTRLYYLYEKLPKKCRELESVITDLKQCFEFDDDGVRPVRASGSRWISHKLNAMKRVVSKYGAYTAHLSALSCDSSVNPSDRARLTGYLRKWTDAKYLLGCAFFVDLLSPCAIFSKTMQSDNLDILGALTSLLRAVKETNKLCSKTLSQWSTYAATVKKVVENEGGPEYQNQELKKYLQAKTYYETNSSEYCLKVTSCIKSRLAWSNMDLIRDIFILGTQGWQKLLDDEHVTEPPPDDLGDSLANPMDAIDRLVEHFKTPLEGANAELDEIRREFEAMVSYAGQFISLSTLDYQSVWWRLFHAPNSSEWSNALKLATLLFSLPISNGKLERTFSKLNIIKDKKRSSLGNESLNDLLAVSAEKCALKDFSPDPAIKLWWESKQRRPCQSKRKQYQPRATGSTSSDSQQESETYSATSDEEENATVMLDDWDQWMNDL